MKSVIPKNLNFDRVSQHAEFRLKGRPKMHHWLGCHAFATFFKVSLAKWTMVILF